MTNDATNDVAAPDDEEIVATSAAAPPQYGVGPFSIREVALVGVWLVAFVVSFFSLSTFGFDSVWTIGILWILTIFVPTVAVFLLVLRRLSPEGIRRVGSLSIDQFASVAFTVSAVFWLQIVWETTARVVAGDPWVRSWVMWVEFVLMLAGVVLTVFAPIIPVLREDFLHRRDVTAHRSARPIRPVTKRPAPAPKPVAEPAPEAEDAEPDDAPSTAAWSDDPVYVTSADDARSSGAPAAYAYQGGTTDDASGPTAETTAFDLDQTASRTEVEHDWAPAERRGSFDTSVYEPVDAEPVIVDPIAPEPAPQPVSQQPFWALVPTERDIVDERGAPLFRIGPTAWALVVEDRGAWFVVRHEDGRIGYLQDVSGVLRG